MRAETADAATLSHPRLGARLPDVRLAPEESLDRFVAWVADSGLTLYPAQEEALLELWAGKHVVLSTPTGSGKSLVALGLHWKALCEGRRSFYTAPVKALVSEKFFALCAELGPEQVGMLTGDASINWAAPVICCTAEVLANMALRQGEAADAPCVVMDEFHFYADPARGVAWQVPLLLLERTQFLLMSATLGNTAPIEEKLVRRSGRAAAHVHSDQRPVPLSFEWRETPLHETVEELLASGRAPVYVVFFTQREAAEQAQALTSAQVATREQRQAIADALAGLRFDSPYGKDVQRILKHGVGLHHAGLLPRYRLLVEQLAQRGLLRVVCGTDTLGVGVNVPIRTVLFSGLVKFDGEKTGLLSVRDFKQISGRAGRKGFDDHGWVVCQAPEHVVENKRIEARAAGGGKKAQKKKPPPGFVGWSKEAFEKLAASPPEMLQSRFRIGHGSLVASLQRGIDERVRGTGHRLLVELIERSHEPPTRKHALRREAARLFRSLRAAGLVQRVFDIDAGSATVRLAPDLQRDFSLHQSLSLYLVDAVGLLDRESPDYARDAMSLVEAILEDPRPVLQQQVQQAKAELVARLKAEGVEYEERMAKLALVTHPKPAEEFLRASFAFFCERHPWLAEEPLRPKSVAREMWEGYEDFDHYVRRYGLQRSEGLLLRYLSQFHNVLVQSVPEAARDDELWDAIGFFRAMLARVDSSLVEEWEERMRPGGDSPRSDRPAPSPQPYDLARHPRALAARVRGELHQLVRALAARDWAAAAASVRADPEDPWDEARFERALAPFFAEHGRLVFEPRARTADKTVLRQEEPRRWSLQQVLCDPGGEDLWHVAGEIDLREERSPAGPLVRVLGIGT